MRTVNNEGQVGRAVWKAKEMLEGEALLEEKHCLEQALSSQSSFTFGSFSQLVLKM